MKKYKIKPYGSYYQYKRKKAILRNLMTAFILLTGVFATLIITNKLKLEDVATLFSMTEQNVKPVVEPFFLEQADIKYGVHTAKPPIKGVYLPATKMTQLDELIKLANETEVNGIVIDIKTDYGYLTFETDNPALQCAVKENPAIPNIKEVMDKLYADNIYPIARIVAFKDNLYSEVNKDQAVTNADGTIFETSKGERWLNPYDKRNWEYLLEISKEAIELGFKEIQFDYIRFHESMDGKALNFPEDKSKTEIITEFTQYMTESLHSYGVNVSADVFGTIITSKIDAEIVGQDYKELSKHLDYICPMIYPSHYGVGSFGIEHPDLQPYELILEVMQYSNMAISDVPREERSAEVRPWLQDFTASWLGTYQEYEDKEVKEQIEATYDALGKEWLLWNGAGSYHEDALEKE
ncbi:MAG: putative glycoside hydrolase [Niameybacter sp.]|uniref:putative glycoside hydrolase n=1 Tax=Niameybacter sp. TaxID=2033640 RepID=UPI002FCBBCE0